MPENNYFPLKRGSKGDLVKSVQVKLNGWGAKLIADGDFGELTERALLHYTGKTSIASQQELNALTQVDGKKTVFIVKYFNDARQNGVVTKVPFIFSLSQAGAESNWGMAAFGNNFFGIKSGKSWTGATQKLKTWECGKTGNHLRDGIKDEVIQIYPPN